MIAMQLHIDAQVLQKINGPGVQTKIEKVDSALLVPVFAAHPPIKRLLPTLDSVGAIYYNPTDSTYYGMANSRWRPISSTGPGVNIYNSNGTLTSNRTVTGAGRSLNWTGLSAFNINGIDALINGLTAGRGGGAGFTNSAFGINALGSNTMGSNNTAIGYNALGNNTIGNANTAFGIGALGNNLTGDNNDAHGFNSLSQNLGNSNTASGSNSLISNTTGNSNTAAGYGAGGTNTTGSNNTYVGSSAGNGITTGSGNTILGATPVALAAALTNNVRITDGVGGLAFSRDASGNSRIAVQALQVVNVSAAGTLSLTNDYSDYVFSGTTATWTLPPIMGYTNVKYFIKNRGTGNITVNSNAGGNDIYTTAAVNTFTIAPGAAYILMCDGTYWDVE